MSKNKNFLTFENEDGSESVYEVISECVVDGESYIAVTPTEYYVLKRVKAGKKEHAYIPVEGEELERVCPIFDAKINIIDHDKE